MWQWLIHPTSPTPHIACIVTAGACMVQKSRWRWPAPQWSASLPRDGSFFIRERSEEHTSELQSLMRISYAVLCLKTNTIDRYTEIRHHATYKSSVREIRKLTSK